MYQFGRNKEGVGYIKNDEKIREQFRRGIRYKKIGFLIILFSTIPMMILDGLMKYISMLIIFIIGVYFERQYKCPSCGYVFDPRVKSDELIYCSKCSEKLQ